MIWRDLLSVAQRNLGGARDGREVNAQVVSELPGDLYYLRRKEGDN
jgi:hypothetical protein